jgi:hypothetical protein
MTQGIGAKLQAAAGGVRYLVLAAAAWLAWAGMAAAQLETSAFTIRDVSVDRTAATAAAARDAALLEGQRTAFRRLLERLVPRSEQRRWPNPSDARLGDLVENFEVQTERTSAVRYIATLTYRFRAEEIRSLLRIASVPFAETYSKLYLVLPVLRREGLTLLWDEPNPWRAAWNGSPALDGLMPIRLPLGDLADISEVNAEQAARGDAARLAPLMARYGAAGVFVADATLEAGAGGRPVLQVAVSHIGGAAGDQTVIESFTAEAGEEEAALMARAVRGTARAIEERWKSEQLLQFGREAKLTVTVAYGTIGDWVAIQKRLAELPHVRRTEIISLSRSEAVVDIAYLGDENQLRLALAQRDLELTAAPLAPSGIPWRLSLGGAQKARSRP